MVQHDFLAELPSWVHLKNHLALTTEWPRPNAGEGVAVMLMIALGGLSDIAALHGQGVSDQVLRAAVGRLAPRIPIGGLLGHARGRNLGIVLPTVADTVVPERLAQELLEALSDPISSPAGALYVSARIGIGLAPASAAVSFERLVHCAETALAGLKGYGAGYRFCAEGRDVR
jgi:GGDEF domain-containing protein